MLTLISQNEKESLNVTQARGYHLKNGDMLVICQDSPIEEWVEEHGLHGIYFDPTEGVYLYELCRHDGVGVVFCNSEANK